MNEQERQAMIKQNFDRVAPGYSHNVLPFFPASAKVMLDLCELKGDEHLLDVATGTGFLALEAAQRLPNGSVVGIDFSSGMLAQARASAESMGLRNLELMEMDMTQLQFRDQHFDLVCCAFGIFFIQNMVEQLNHMTTKVKQQGRVVISCFESTTFAAFLPLFLDRLLKYGIEQPPLMWRQIDLPDKCRLLFQQAGFSDISVFEKDLGYYLASAEEWWAIIWNAGFRSLVAQLSAENLQKFKDEHLAEIAALATDKGNWLNMKILYTIGKRT